MRGQEEPRSDDATAVDAEINSQRRRLSRRQTLDLLTFESCLIRATIRAEK